MLRGVIEYNFREQCKEVPNTSYLTHGIHDFPAKFIPQIPRYFIRKYTKPGDTILDPFCGCGSTLVEAKIHGVKGLGYEISKLGNLMTYVKTTPINTGLLKRVYYYLIRRIQNKKRIDISLINFPNITHWFDDYVICDLLKIKTEIQKINLQNKKLKKDVQSFFKVCLSSIIRASSRADPDIPQPLITKKMRAILKKGRKVDVLSLFKNSVEKRIAALEEFNKVTKNSKIRILENDSRLMNLNEEIDLIVTSPPYINAQEYFRIQKLELFWLGLVNEKELKRLNKKIIGTEKIPYFLYKDLHKFGNKKLDRIIERVYRKDKKRAYIIFQYFKDMKKVLHNCFNALKPDKYLCIVIGNNTIRQIYVPTNEFIYDICIDIGFIPESKGVDKIKNRVLNIKRRVTDKVMDVEWVLVFKKP